MLRCKVLYMLTCESHIYAVVQSLVYIFPFLDIILLAFGSVC